MSAPGGEKPDEYALAPFNCVGCGTAQEVAYYPPAVERLQPYPRGAPHPGTTIICLKCAAANVVVSIGEERTVVRRPTGAELLVLYSSRAFLVMTAAAQIAINERRKRGRDITGGH